MFDLKTDADCLDYSEPVLIARAIADQKLMDRVARVKLCEMKDITGLQAHLHLLIHSELGQYFLYDDNVINLKEAIDDNALVRCLTKFD